jgi:hypothetical protein
MEDEKYLVRKTLEEARNTPLSQADREALEKMAERQAAGDDSQIDYSDIPQLTDEQLANAFRFRDREKNPQWQESMRRSKAASTNPKDQ